MNSDLKAAIDERLVTIVRYTKLIQAEVDPLRMAELNISRRRLVQELRQVEDQVMTMGLKVAVYEEVLSTGLTIGRNMADAKKRVQEAKEELQRRHIQQTATQAGSGNGGVG
jgi:hypothetical protein